MNIAVFFIFLWVSGGLLLIGGIRDNPKLAETLLALRRFDPAALIALALFLLTWPAIFVFAHVGKLRGNR